MALLPSRLLASLALSLLAATAGATEMVVIVSVRNPAPALRTEQVAAIFLGQTGRFPDGLEAVALDQPIGSPLRDEFYLRVTNKSPALLKAWWSKIVFTGRGQPPREAADNAAVRKMVAENPSMIGYIERSALDATVRPLLLLR
jgi:ABC-type phosphate transport system substrate-binding protein